MVSCSCVWVRVGDGTCGLQEAEAGGAVRRRGPAVGRAREMLRGGWSRPPRLSPSLNRRLKLLQGKGSEAPS